MNLHQEDFIHKLAIAHQNSAHVVPRSVSCALLDGVLQLLFPPLAERTFSTASEIIAYQAVLQSDLELILVRLRERLPHAPDVLAAMFFEKLPYLYDILLHDAKAIEEGDPAAVNTEEVMRTYPGFLAVAIYRLAHELYLLRVPLLPRIFSEYAHARTGIDIHPGARIGSHFCIDHGTGVVIGETAIIGNYVKVYQGVTLGALSVDKAMANIKRHPTIEDYVIIYAGATILGGNTVIGTRSLIGGNVWLTESVPPYSRVYHTPQIRVSRASELNDVLDFSI